MAPVVPNPAKIRAFTSDAMFEAWLRAHHARETEIWLRIYKKDSGKPTITAAESLDVALCWGWIDGIRKTFDDESFLQRYTPRRPKSIWSQVRAAIDANPRARKTFHTLGRMNLFALAFRTNNMKTRAAQKAPRPLTTAAIVRLKT